MTDLVGKTLGKYRVVSKIGSGGMAAVYRAVDVRIGREVAIKVLPHWKRNDRAHVGRFIREVRLLADLSHPSIIGIFDFGQEGEVVYYVMELLTGGSLTEIIRTTGMFSRDRLFKLARDMASALECIHGLGILHRDIKPHNILLADAGDFKLADFGLGTAEDFATLTRTGEMIGTLKYLPPEGLEGQSLDQTGDLFQLGLVLYEAATAQRPYKGGSAIEILRSYSRDTPQAVTELNPGLPEGFNSLIMNLIQMEKADRYQDAALLLSDLARLEKGQAVRQRTIQGKKPRRGVVEEAPPPPPSRVPWKWLAAGSAALVTIGVLGLIASLLAPAPPPPAGIHMVQILAGAERVRVEWTSDGDYAGRIEYRIGDSPVVSVLHEEKPTRKHTVVIDGLEPDREYFVKIKSPHPDEAVEQHAKTRALSLDLEKAESRADGGRLVWRASQKLKCLLIFEMLGRQDRLEVPPGPKESFDVTYRGLEPRIDHAVRLVGQNAVEESVTLDVQQKIGQLAAPLVERLKSEDFKALLTNFQQVAKLGNPATTQGVVNTALGKRAFLPYLTNFLPFLTMYLRNARFPLDARLFLHQRLSQLEAVEAAMSGMGVTVDLPIALRPEGGLGALGAPLPPGATASSIQAKPFDLRVHGRASSALEGIGSALGAIPDPPEIEFRLEPQWSRLAGAAIEVECALGSAVTLEATVNGKGPMIVGPTSSGSSHDVHRLILPADVLLAKSNTLLLAARAFGFTALTPVKVTVAQVRLLAARFEAEQSLKPFVDTQDVSPR